MFLPTSTEGACVFHQLEGPYPYIKHRFRIQASLTSCGSPRAGIHLLQMKPLLSREKVFQTLMCISEFIDISPGNLDFSL